jgi:hypothetical protein
MRLGSKSEIRSQIPLCYIWATQLLGHIDVRTTMIYPHMLNRGGQGVTGSADRLSATGMISYRSYGL